METDPASKALAAALARQVGGNATEADATQHDYVAKHGKAQPHYTAERYALRKQPDAMSAWLERARQAAAADVAALLPSDPLLRYKDAPRFAALCKQMGLTVPTDAVATP